MSAEQKDHRTQGNMKVTRKDTDQKDLNPLEHSMTGIFVYMKAGDGLS